MLNKIIHFIKYHNAFVFIFVMVFVGFSVTMAASPDLREGVSDALVSSEETVRSIDNALILAADLDSFDMALQVQGVDEDDENYYVGYEFKTIDIEDGAWQEVVEEKVLVISKKAIGDKIDLGVYVGEELNEVAGNQIAYLLEVQQKEKKKGQAPKIVSVRYAGLIGKFLSPKEKVFSGYEVVVKQPVVIMTSKEGAEVYSDIQEQVDMKLDSVVSSCEDTSEGCPSETTTPTTIPTTPTTSTTTIPTTSTTTIPTTSTTTIPTTSTTTIPEITCTPDWQCNDWQGLAETFTCGEVFTQTRTCTDINECGTDENKPAETQDAICTDSTTCNLTSCDVSLNLAGECQNTCVDGVCQTCLPTCACATDFSDCDNNLTNGCEIASSTCPTSI